MKSHRYGFTLVELLVVLAVVSLLAAIILPSVKSLLTDRKASQTAILVKNFIEAARSQAIGRRRQIAVVLERVSSRAADLNGDGQITSLDIDPALTRFRSGTSSEFTTSPQNTAPDTNFIPYNSCIKLSLAEEPPPVTSALLSRPVSIKAVVVVNPQNGTQQTDVAIPASYYTGQDSLGTVVGQITQVDNTSMRHLSDDETSVFQVTGANVFSLLGEHLIAGNEISFGNSSDRFLITSPSSPVPHFNYTTNEDDSKIWFSIANSRIFHGVSEIASRPYVDLSNIMTNSFRIYLKPKPIYGQTLQLPRGMCVDLSLSGFAQNKERFDMDYRVRFASDWVRNGSDGVPKPNELRPVYLVFSPNGSLSHVFANQRRSMATTRIDVTDDVFLHVGKIDQVVMPVDRLNFASVRERVYFDFFENAGVKQNLSDNSCFAIRVASKSGSVSAAPISYSQDQEILNGVPQGTATLGDYIQFSRQSVYSNGLSGQ